MSPVIVAAVVLLLLGLAGLYFYNQRQQNAARLAIANDPRNQIGAGAGSLVSGLIGVIHV